MKAKTYAHLFTKIERTLMKKTTYRHCIMRIIFIFSFSVFFLCCLLWSPNTDALVLLLSSRKMKWQRQCLVVLFSEEGKRTRSLAETTATTDNGMDHLLTSRFRSNVLLLWISMIRSQWNLSTEIGYGTWRMIAYNEHTEKANETGSSPIFSPVFLVAVFFISEIIFSKYLATHAAPFTIYSIMIFILRLDSLQTK